MALGAGGKRAAWLLRVAETLTREPGGLPDTREKPSLHPLRVCRRDRGHHRGMQRGRARSPGMALVWMRQLPRLSHASAGPLVASHTLVPTVHQAHAPEARAGAPWSS